MKLCSIFHHQDIEYLLFQHLILQFVVRYKMSEKKDDNFFETNTDNGNKELTCTAIKTYSWKLSYLSFLIIFLGNFPKFT